MNPKFQGFHKGTGDETHAPHGVLEVLVAGEGTETYARQVHIAQAGASNSDWNIAASAHPILAVHSGTTPITDYARISHDGTTGTLQAVGGTLDLTGVGRVTVNEGSADVDFRVEGANAANVIFADAGQDAVSLGGANVDGAALILNNLQSRTAITSVGHQAHVPAQTTNFDNGSGTVAVGAAVFVGIPTYTGDTATLTFTDLASVYVAGEPVDSTNVTGTTSWAMLVAANDVGLTTGNLRFGAKNAFGTTEPTQAIVIESGTAPVGAITTSNGVFSSDTVLRKIIADGTASNVG